MNKTEDDNNATPRQTCRPGRVERNAFGAVVSAAGSTMRANTRNRIQAISIAGRLSDRYFAIASEQAKNTVDPMINAMPRNGRSARASTERLSALVSSGG